MYFIKLLSDFCGVVPSATLTAFDGKLVFKKRILCLKQNLHLKRNTTCQQNSLREILSFLHTKQSQPITERDMKVAAVWSKVFLISSLTGSEFFFRIFKWIFLFQVQNLFFFFSFFLTQKRFLLKTVGVGLGMMAQNHLTAFHIPFALCSFTLRCLC